MMFTFNVGVFLLLSLCHIVASEKAVICYYGTWATYRNGHGKFDVENINPDLCTHLIYTFAGIDNSGNIISLDPYLDLPDNYGRDNFGKFNALKKKNPSLKTLLAVGGWNEGSAKYSMMAANSTLRKNFIDSAIKIITQHGFDGLDLDWEYPNRRDTVHGEEDIENYTTLLRELRKAFDENNLLLTAAVSSIKSAASQSYDVPAISQYLDIVNIMTYDMYGAWDPVTGHNSPLHKGEGDEQANAEDLNTVDKALDFWISEGCPPNKIAIGTPFYGRTYTLKNATENGVRAPANGAGLAGPYTATNGLMGYNEICLMLQNESWTQRYDSLAKVPYAYKNNNWISYDDPNSIAIKIDYAKKLGIDKVMMWSIETDDFYGACGNGDNALLISINAALESEVTTETHVTVDIKSSSIMSSPSVDSGSSSTLSSPRVSESSATSDLECKLEGFSAKPGDCSSFYYCIKNANGVLVPKEFKCPANLYWDQSILVCNYREVTECNA